MNTISYQKYFYSISPELRETEKLIRKELHTENPALHKAALHLITNGGKRMRPAFLLLTGKLFTEKLDALLPMAAAMEIAHVGTLVHDDVIDASDLRRGVETVRMRYGEEMSVCAGNYLFARALELAMQSGDARIIRRLTEGCCLICKGEIQQLKEAFSLHQHFRDYLRRIRKKTALLISLSCEIGAIQCGANEQQIRALRKYGDALGMAFQIRDDILDFTAKEEVLGKPVGSDVKNGLITLPLLYALQASPDKEQLQMLLQTSKEGMDEIRVQKIVQLVQQSSGIAAAMQLAQRYAARAKAALAIFPDTPAKKNLLHIAQQVVERDF